MVDARRLGAVGNRALPFGNLAHASFIHSRIALDGDPFLTWGSFCLTFPLNAGEPLPAESPTTGDPWNLIWLEPAKGDEMSFKIKEPNGVRQSNLIGGRFCFWQLSFKPGRFLPLLRSPLVTPAFGIRPYQADFAQRLSPFKLTNLKLQTSS